MNESRGGISNVCVDTVEAKLTRWNACALQCHSHYKVDKLRKRAVKTWNWHRQFKLDSWKRYADLPSSQLKWNLKKKGKLGVKVKFETSEFNEKYNNNFIYAKLFNYKIKNNKLILI